MRRASPIEPTDLSNLLYFPQQLTVLLFLHTSWFSRAKKSKYFTKFFLFWDRRRGWCPVRFYSMLRWWYENAPDLQYPKFASWRHYCQTLKFWIRSLLLEFKVNSNGCQITLFKRIICESSQQRWLTNWAIPNQYNFIHEVVCHILVSEFLKDLYMILIMLCWGQTNKT